MNRQQFLVELTQYLTFFSPEEKARLISAYNEKFDSAGPENEAILLAELGTPMMTAIELKRRMESGDKIAVEPEACNQAAQDETLSEYSVETETEETLMASAEASEPASEEPLATSSEAPVEQSLNEPLEQPFKESNETAPLEPVTEPFEQNRKEAFEKPINELSEKNSPAPAIEKQAPRRKASVGGLIGATLLSLIITAFFLVIAAVGAGFLVAMSYLLLTGLKNLLYLEDALLLFGGGLVCAALGLIILWFAVWSAISLISKLYKRALGAASNKERDA